MARRNFTLADIKSGKLHVGMKVRVNELDNIKGIWMLLKDAEVIDDENGICTSEGILYKISTKRISVTEHNTSLVYNDPKEVWKIDITNYQIYSVDFSYQQCGC